MTKPQEKKVYSLNKEIRRDKMSTDEKLIYRILFCLIILFIVWGHSLEQKYDKIDQMQAKILKMQDVRIEELYKMIRSKPVINWTWRD